MLVRLMEHDTGLRKSGQVIVLALVVLEILQFIAIISSALLIADYYSNNALNFSAGNFFSPIV
jgi:hypothetical protein